MLFRNGLQQFEALIAHFKKSRLKYFETFCHYERKFEREGEREKGYANKV